MLYFFVEARWPLGIFYTMLFKCGKHTRNFWGVSFLSYFRFLYSQGAFTETVFPLPLVGYEITVGQLGATRIVSYLPFYRQRVEYTLTAPSNLVKLFTTQT